VVAIILNALLPDDANDPNDSIHNKDNADERQSMP
jgi:hypothetical protein